MKKCEHKFKIEWVTNCNGIDWGPKYWCPNCGALYNYDDIWILPSPKVDKQYEEIEDIPQ